MDNNEIHSKLNVFSAFVQKKLMEKNIISSHEEILLIPHYCMNIYKKQCSHYIIKCLSSNQRFFLKILKGNDNAFHCNKYLHKFLSETGECLYPTILVPEFEFDGMKYYITSFIDGVSLDNITETLTNDEWRIIASKLRSRLNELSTIHSSLYSEHNDFLTDDCATILKEKFLKRFSHPLFHAYSHKELGEAYERCCKILEASRFTKPTLLHMDVKPANIIYNSKTGLVTLIDFEFARFGDIDYGWTQVLLSGINAFRKEYKEQIVPRLTEGYLNLEEALEIPKFQCYIFYQTACNLIYYYEHNTDYPREIKELFEKLLKKLSKEQRI